MHLVFFRKSGVTDNFCFIGGGDADARWIVHLTAGSVLEVFGHPHGYHGIDDWELEMKVQIMEASRGLPRHNDMKGYGEATLAQTKFYLPHKP
jgi:hypothetical protein